MTMIGRFKFIAVAFIWSLLVVSAYSQTCYSGGDLDATSKARIEQAASQYMRMAAQGDVFGLRQNAIPAIANNFGGIERAVVDNKEFFAAGQPTIRGTYLLDASAAQGTLERAEFFCGVFGSLGQTVQSAGFMIPNLPAGRYALVIQDVNGPKGLHTLTLILQELNSQWKLAGFYAKTGQIGGHDADWFANQARQFKAKGQNRNAYFYFIQARDLAAPVPFMSTLKLDRLYDEATQVLPKDLPQATGSPVPFQAKGKTFNIISMFPVVVGEGLNLVVKYETPDISNTTQTFQDNTALMKAMLERYPEYREGFEGMVARAVAPSGQDYGTLLAMKDIK